MRWRTSVSSHVGVVFKQPLVAKAVAAAVLQLPQAHGHGPAQAMDVVALVDVLLAIFDAPVEAAPVLLQICCFA